MASWHSLRLAEAIRALALGCTIVPRSEPTHWYRLIDDPQLLSVVDLEPHLGLELERAEYNHASLARVRATQKTYLGRCSGFNDLWVPVPGTKRQGNHPGDNGVLVFGPFLTEAPTVEWLYAEWLKLSKRATDPDDAGFLKFVECAMDSHVFAGPALEALTAFVERVAVVISGTSVPRAYSQQLADWRRLLHHIPEARMWQIAQDLVDRQRHVVWTAGLRSKDLLEEGVRDMPDHVLVAAPYERAFDSAGAAATLLRVNQLQRTCAAFGTELGGALAGRVGRGAAFLLVHVGARRRDGQTKLFALAERLMRFAQRKLNIRIACGISNRAKSSDQLPARHDEALWAALWGLHSRRSVTFYSDIAGSDEATSAVALYRHSRKLYESFGRGSAREVAMSTQQMIKDVLWISGGSIESMRSHFLEIVWELIGVIERRSGMDEKTSSATLAGISNRLQTARSAPQITNAFHAIVGELFDGMQRPGALSRKASLERARRLVTEAEPGDVFTIGRVAKRVGMSVGHFSRCFRDAYGSPFREFVLMTRLSRSHRMLRETELPIRDIAREAGFSSASYFVQAFRRTTGVTPTEYRALSR